MKKMKRTPFVGRRKLLLALAFQLFAVVLFAQVRISGRITSKGTGVPATVLVRNTTFGTGADENGNYVLSAPLKPGSYTLVFSAVGFKSFDANVTIGSASTYTVNADLAADALNLDEVVVTGTSQGTTRRQLGSFIGTVRAEDLTQGAPNNVLQALQGKTPGAQITQNSGDPAGGMSVRLRGINTISSSSEPLYIIDGVIISNATNRVTNTSGNYDGNNFVGNIGQNRAVDINPNDIERIEVLPGAAAAAIYGSRANAGVIQIFTKRGSSGAPVVTFSTSVQVNQLRKKLLVNQAPTKFGGSPDVQTQDILTPALTNTTPVTRYDYQDYIFQSGIGTDNNVSITGGRDKTKYYASASYFGNEGIVKNTDFKRFGFRLNLDQELSSKLKFNIGLNYVNSFGNEKPDGQSFFSPTNAVTIIGNFHNITERDALGNLKAVGERGRVNPVSIIEDFKQSQQTSRIISNLGLKYSLMKNLSIDYTLGFDNYAQNGTTFIPPFTYNVSDGFFGGGPTLDPTRNGYASTATNNFFQVNSDINATYTANITSDLGSTTQLGYSYQYERNRYMLLQGRGLAPFVETVNGASTIIPGVDDRGEQSIAGAFLQQNFKFRNQLFITGAVRLDGSSVFGKNQRSQVYTKASASYVISGGDFWKSSSVAGWWDLAKVRVAYGESGNLTGIGAYERFNTYTSSSYIGRTGLNSRTTLANADVKPERQQELEFGADLSFFRNRLGLTANVYVKKVKDLLLNRVIAPTTGFNSKLDNFGELENRGFELLLTAVPVTNKDFTWDVTAIFNRNRNKALRIGQALTLFSTNAGAPVAILEGQPIGVFYGTFFATDGSGNQIKNTSGIPTIERGVQNGPLAFTPQRDQNGLPLATGTVLRRIIGDPNPDYTATLTNEFTYKKLGLRFQLDAVQGVDVFNADFRTRQGVGNGVVAEQEHRGQLPRGYISGIYAIEEWRIDDGSFVKLREIALTYRVGKWKVFNDLNFSLSGRNLISWDNYKGYDPEVNAAGQSTILRGIDFGSVPIPRTFRLGLVAKF